MKNVLYKRQLQHQEQQLQQQQQQEGGELLDNNSRHSNNNVFLPFGNNEDGVSSLGSLEPRSLIVVGDAIVVDPIVGDPIVGDVDPTATTTTTTNALLYPSNSVLDSEGKGVIDAVS